MLLVLPCRELCASLDRAEEILSKQRFIAGSRFTEADLRLFVTLIRFDEVSIVPYSMACNMQDFCDVRDLICTQSMCHWHACIM